MGNGRKLIGEIMNFQTVRIESTQLYGVSCITESKSKKVFSFSGPIECIGPDEKVKPGGKILVTCRIEYGGPIEPWLLWYENDALNYDRYIGGKGIT